MLEWAEKYNHGRLALETLLKEVDSLLTLEEGAPAPEIDEPLSVLMGMYSATVREGRYPDLALEERAAVNQAAWALEHIARQHHLLHTCPCCGYPAFKDPPGSYEICHVCVWEDDPVQLRWAMDVRGANRVTLLQAQRNYQVLGAKEERALGFRFRVAPCSDRDPEWRPIDPERDHFEAWASRRTADWPDDATQLYYWSLTYWRRQPSDSTPA